MTSERAVCVPLVCCALLGGLATRAEEPELTHARTVDARPSEPLRMFGLRVPFKTAPLGEGGSFTLDYHLGNTWNPTTALAYPDHRYRLYEADGVIRQLTVRYAEPLAPGWELELALTSYMLVDGSSPADALASDRFIEWTHGWLVAQHDPFQRRLNGLDSRASIMLRDLNGQTERLKAGDALPGTFDLGLTRYFEVVKRDDWLVTASFAAVVGFPLSRFNEFLAVGVAPGAVVTRRLWRWFSATLAVAVPVQLERVLRVNPGTDFIDRQATAGYRAMFALTATTAGGVRITAELEVQGATPAMASRGQQGPVDPAQVGYASPYLAGTGLQRSANSMRMAAEYMALAVLVTPGHPSRAPTLAIVFQEDWKPLTGSRPGRFFHESDNAQDWGVGLRLEWPIDLPVR